ncbi:MAG: hypothetical protein CFE33_20860 [Pseudorhodobacter sp. PARRP1]|nr:MAG: hypothetical protein CFE33_20860 [Pseudorhodobacter sp. PARRP1]
MRKLFFSAVFVFAANSGSAGAIEDDMRGYVDSEVRAWLADPTILSAVRVANVEHAQLTQSDVTALDAKWQAEVGAKSGLVSNVMDSAPAGLLRERVAASGGKVTEIIVMDRLGLNVAISSVTSDYWQGDEDKFMKTFATGNAAGFLSEVELDESTQSYQAQFSFILNDPANGESIGAVTVGLNAEAF